MKYGKLGKSDIEISKVVLGCMTFSGGANWGDQDERDSIDTIRAALDSGITAFDTAEGYAAGLTETILGKALGADRQKVSIFSKFSLANSSYDKVIESCEASLKRLGTDYIDLYMIHWPSREVPFEETTRALEKLVADGKVRAIGVSNFGKEDLTKILPLTNVVADQLAYNLFFRGIEYSIKPLCEENGVGVLTYSSLAQGLLSGKYKTADEFPAGRARTKYFSSSREFVRHGGEGCEEEVFGAIQKISKICDEIGEPMANVALAWSIAQPGISGVIAGGRTAEQARINAEAGNLELSKDVIAELTSITEGIKAHFGDDADPWMDGRIR